MSDYSEFANKRHNIICMKGYLERAKATESIARNMLEEAAELYRQAALLRKPRENECVYCRGSTIIKNKEVDSEGIIITKCKICQRCGNETLVKGP